MVKNNIFQQRFYGEWVDSKGLTTQKVIVDETDLFISSSCNVKNMAERFIKKYRLEIQKYIKYRPKFKESMEPLELDTEERGIIKEMFHCSNLADVGPMASVAGAIAEFVGRDLLDLSQEVIVENGGDIFIKTDVERKIGIFAGKSPLNGKIFIKIKSKDTPLGICTSSGTVEQTFSFGKADACVIISKSTTLADAVATAICNKVKKSKDIRPALKFAHSIGGVKGALIILGKDFGAIGDIELE